MCSLLTKKKLNLRKKRCLRASENPHKLSLKVYLMNRSTPFSVTFLEWWPTFPTSGTQKLLFPKKLEAGCFQNEYKKYVKMNLSAIPVETFCNGLDFWTLWDLRHYAWRLRANKVAFKEKILKIYDFLALNNARFKQQWVRKHSLKKMNITWYKIYI